MRRRARPALLCTLLAAALLAPPAAVRAADGDVRVSSIGYVTGGAKRVSVLGGAGGAAFVVRRAADGGMAFQGALGTPIADASGDMVAVGDFGMLDTAGSYYVDVAGVGRSASFPIAGDAYRPALYAAMLGFHGWRCGTAVAFGFGDHAYGHGACHLDDGHLDRLPAPVGGADVTRDGRRGWHDAGDYGKYTVNGAFAAGILLDAWERHRGALEGLQLPIPEAGGVMPDYLDEIRWELDWLLTMQYSATDGRVSHKLTRLGFEGFVMPEDDDGLRYFVPYGTAATADFVAVLAQAARVYMPYDAAFAARCLAAARVSYAYLTANTANVAADQTDFTTGTYGTTDPDDRMWAAAEMWETTGDAAALADIEARITSTTDTTARPLVDADFDWGNSKNLALFTYLLSARAGRDAALVTRVQQRTMTAADAVVSAHAASGYGRGVSRFYWGSNGSVARATMLLDAAHRLSGQQRYLDVAADQIANLFGRNHYNRSQVTGVGLAPPTQPHHRPSRPDLMQSAWPGLLVGGGTTAINWVDDWEDFMVNEVAVNWNAPLVYGLALFAPDGAWPPAMPLPPDAGAPGTGDDGGAGQGGASGSEDGGGGAGNTDVDGGTRPPSATSIRKGCSCDAGGTGGGGALWSGFFLLVALATRARARHRT